MFTIRPGWSTEKSESVNIYHNEKFVACILEKIGKAHDKAGKIIALLETHKVNNYTQLKENLPYHLWFKLISILDFSQKWI